MIGMFDASTQACKYSEKMHVKCSSKCSILSYAVFGSWRSNTVQDTRKRLRDSVIEAHREEKILVGPPADEVERICPSNGRILGAGVPWNILEFKPLGPVFLERHTRNHDRREILVLHCILRVRYRTAEHRSQRRARPFHMSFAVWNANEAFGMCTIAAAYGAN